MRRTGGALTAGVVGMLLAVIAGCGYNSQFSCKGYPESPSCRSVSDNFDRRFEPSPPSQDLIQEGRTRESAGSSTVPPPAPAFAGKMDSLLGKPVLVPADVLRVWIAPYQDSKARLHDAAHVYVVLSDAQFLYGHRQGTRGVALGYRPGVEFLPKTSRMVERAARSKPGVTGAATPAGSNVGVNPYQDLSIQDEIRRSMAQQRVNGLPGAPTNPGQATINGAQPSPVDPYGFEPNVP